MLNKDGQPAPLPESERKMIFEKVIFAFAQVRWPMITRRPMGIFVQFVEGDFTEADYVISGVRECMHVCMWPSRAMARVRLHAHTHVPFLLSCLIGVMSLCPFRMRLCLVRR